MIENFQPKCSIMHDSNFKPCEMKGQSHFENTKYIAVFKKSKFVK